LWRFYQLLANKKIAKKVEVEEEEEEKPLKHGCCNEKKTRLRPLTMDPLYGTNCFSLKENRRHSSNQI